MLEEDEDEEVAVHEDDGEEGFAANAADDGVGLGDGEVMVGIAIGEVVAIGAALAASLLDNALLGFAPALAQTAGSGM